MQVNVVGHQIKELFEKSKQALVVLQETNDVDQIAVATGLIELFGSYGKKAALLTKTTLPDATKPLVKSEQLKARLEPKSLVVSFDWSENQLDKVSYFLEGNKFNLVISSRGKRLKSEDLNYSYQGTDFDLLICVGIGQIAQLKSLGLEEEVLNSTPSINLDRSPTNENFAKVNVVGEGRDSLSAVTANLLKEAGINLPTRVAEIFLYAIRVSTNNFATVTDPATFEAAAFCKRSMIPGLAPTKPSVNEEKSTTQEETPEGWLSPKVFRSGKFS